MLEHLREQSYWVDSTTFPHLDPHAPLPDRVDVAIVGGGYTGLNAARELAKGGASVAVFEAHSFGWGASSRNGGQVLTGTKLSAAGLVKRFGPTMAKRMFNASLDAVAFVERTVREEGIACGFTRGGHIELAYKAAHMTHFEHEAAVLNNDFGHPVSLLTRDGLAQELASPRYFGGLRDDASAGLHPGRYAAGLISAAQRAGANLFERVQVLSITPRTAAHRPRIATTRGNLSCDQVFIATNGYTDGIVPDLQRRIVPIGSYIIATEPLSEALAREIDPNGRMFYDSKNYLFYWRMTDDRRLVFGGRAEFVPPTPSSTRRSAVALRNGMLYVYPQLQNVAIAYAWGGTLGFTFDLLPHAGTTPNGIHYALGCGGHGVAMLSHLGANAAWRMLGATVDNPTFDMPFPGAPLGLYNGTPWFMPFAGLYYRAMDWLT
jgi:glycine/D-amino acid oxidase-like deaminating enzyme